MLKLKLHTLATWCKEPTHWKRPWCWERLKAGEEEDDRGWDGWMVPPTRWTWVWVGSGNWWWTGKPGVLQSMEYQSVGHNWVTKLNWYIMSWKSYVGYVILLNIEYKVFGCLNLDLQDYFWHFNLESYFLYFPFEVVVLWKSVNNCQLNRWIDLPIYWRDSQFVILGIYRSNN